MDLSDLRGEVTFSCNRGYLLFDALGFSSTYWTVEDMLDVQQFRREFERFNGPVKFAAEDLKLEGCLQVPFSRVPFDNEPEFSSTPPFHFGGTVMYLMIQLAAFMGCSVAYLLGNDFSWSTDHVSVQRDGWKTEDMDENHFDPTYWPQGTRSFPPQPDRMRRAFHAANHARKIRVVNLTPDSALDVFETDSYDKIFERDTPMLGMEQHRQEIESLTDLVRTVHPHHVLEIGVRGGGTSALWHSLCTGFVIGVDKVDNLQLERFPRYRSVVGDSHQQLTRLEVERLLDGQKVDLLFLDGDHSYQGAGLDYVMYRHLLRPGGIIALHDINASSVHFEPWENGGVPRFWGALSGEKQVFSVQGDWGGIGVVRV
jgi:hypothetical protein